MIITEYMENGSLDTFLRANDGKFQVALSYLIVYLNYAIIVEQIRNSPTIQLNFGF